MAIMFSSSLNIFFFTLFLTFFILFVGFIFLLTTQDIWERRIKRLRQRRKSPIIDDESNHDED